jgi:hypothetical protein
MRFPRNWTAVIFFGTLALLHLANAVPAFLRGNIAGETSAILAVTFIIVSVVFLTLRSELAIRPGAEDVRLSRTLLRVWTERRIPFKRIRGVRVFLEPNARDEGSQIELLTDDGDVDCPRTAIPRQQALWMAMVMNVELIKVTGQKAPSEVDRPLVSDPGRLHDCL